MLIINGQVLEGGSPETTLLNRGFKFGDGLFEEMRIYKGKVLFVDLHISRMISGMKSLKFKFDDGVWRQKIKDALRKGIEINQIRSNGRLRLHIYRSGTGAFAPLSHEPFYLLEAYALKDNYFESNIHTSLTEYTEMLLAAGVLAPYYAGNSLTLTLATIYARDLGFEEALLFGPQGISMTSTGNLFLIKQKKIFTPALESACVAGVMRSQIISLAHRLKLPVLEKKLKTKDLLSADEMFVCNEVRGIVPVARYNDRDMQPESYVITPFLMQCLQQYIEEIS